MRPRLLLTLSAAQQSAAASACEVANCEMLLRSSLVMPASASLRQPPQRLPQRQRASHHSALVRVGPRTGSARATNAEGEATEHGGARRR